MPDIVTVRCIRWAQAQETILHLNIQFIFFHYHKQFTNLYVSVFSYFVEYAEKQSGRSY